MPNINIIVYTSLFYALKPGFHQIINLKSQKNKLIQRVSSYIIKKTVSVEILSNLFSSFKYLLPP